MKQPIHKRLRDWRDRSIRQDRYRPVYAHFLMVAHMDKRLVTDDHPSWQRIDAALAAAREGDATALDTIQRELARLWD